MRKQIEIKNMRVDAEIGIHDFEQGTQPYEITVRLTLSNNYYVCTDSIADAVNYDGLRDRILKLFISGKRVNLQETVIQEIMWAAFGLDVRITAVEVSVAKPTVYPSCDGVGLLYQSTREEWFRYSPHPHHMPGAVVQAR